MKITKAQHGRGWGRVQWRGAWYRRQDMRTRVGVSSTKRKTLEYFRGVEIGASGMPRCLRNNASNSVTSSAARSPLVLRIRLTSPSRVQAWSMRAIGEAWKWSNGHWILIIGRDLNIVAGWVMDICTVISLYNRNIFFFIKNLQTEVSNLEFQHSHEEVSRGPFLTADSQRPKSACSWAISRFCCACWEQRRNSRYHIGSRECYILYSHPYH